jgi:AcrR family transcriptional regulator
VQPGSGGDRPQRSFVEAARRTQIVEAAIATIAEEGYARASFVRIAKRASISPGLISYHFTGKDELILEVLRTVAQRLDRAMAGSGEAASYVEALHRIVSGYVHHCAAHPLEVRALQEIRAGAGSPAVQRLVAEQRRSGLEELRAFIAEGQAEAEFRAGNPAVFADTLWAAMHGVPSRLQGRTGPESEDYATELAWLFVHAAAAPGTTGLRHLQRTRRLRTSEATPERPPDPP